MQVMMHYWQEVLKVMGITGQNRSIWKFFFLLRGFIVYNECQRNANCNAGSANGKTGNNGSAGNANGNAGNGNADNPNGNAGNANGNITKNLRNIMQ